MQTSAEGLFMDSDMHARLADLVGKSSVVQRVDDMAREYHRATDILHEEEGEGEIHHEVHRAIDKPGRTRHHHHGAAAGGAALVDLDDALVHHGRHAHRRAQHPREQAAGAAERQVQPQPPQHRPACARRSPS